jgi:hypothetical protein
MATLQRAGLVNSRGIGQWTYDDERVRRLPELLAAEV